MHPEQKWHDEHHLAARLEDAVDPAEHPRESIDVFEGVERNHRVVAPVVARKIPVGRN